MADVTITDNSHVTVEITKADHIEMTDLLKKNDEVICLTYGAYVLALTIGLDLLQQGHWNVARVTKGF